MIDYDIAITNYCQAKCPSCKRHEDYFPDFPKDWNGVVKYNKNIPLVHMKFNDYKKIINENIELFENKNVEFVGEFGDPMVNPKVEDFIDFTCSWAKSLRISTNGGIRREKFYINLSQYANLSITFAIDGISPETNNKYRINVDTIRAFQNLIAYARNTKKGRCAWDYLIFSHNYFEIPEVLEFAEEHNIPVNLKMNNRPKFLLDKKLYSNVQKIYEHCKTENSNLIMVN